MIKNEFEFGELTFKSGNKSLFIKMKNPKKHLIGTFLMSDIQGADPSYAIKEIDDVLEEEKDFSELNGNVCGLEIQKDKTKIYDNLAEDGMGEWCEIDTLELKELIIIWSNKVKEFRKVHPYG